MYVLVLSGVLVRRAAALSFIGCLSGLFLFKLFASAGFLHRFLIVFLRELFVDSLRICFGHFGLASDSAKEH